MSVITKDSTLHGMTKEERYQFNKLVRLQSITRLESDIIFDLRVCQLEGWDCREYIRMIRGNAGQAATLTDKTTYCFMGRGFGLN